MIACVHSPDADACTLCLRERLDAQLRENDRLCAVVADLTRERNELKARFA